MLRTADPDLRRQPRPTRTANRSAWWLSRTRAPA